MKKTYNKGFSFTPLFNNELKEEIIEEEAVFSNEESSVDYEDTGFLIDITQKNSGNVLHIKTASKNFKIGDELKVVGLYGTYFGKVLAVNGQALSFLTMDKPLDNLGIQSRQKVYKRAG